MASNVDPEATPVIGDGRGQRGRVGDVERHQLGRVGQPVHARRSRRGRTPGRGCRRRRPRRRCARAASPRRWSGRPSTAGCHRARRCRRASATTGSVDGTSGAPVSSAVPSGATGPVDAPSGPVAVPALTPGAVVPAPASSSSLQAVGDDGEGEHGEAGAAAEGRSHGTHCSRRGAPMGQRAARWSARSAAVTTFGPPWNPPRSRSSRAPTTSPSTGATPPSARPSPAVASSP